MSEQPQIRIFVSESFDPRFNLALEDLLFDLTAQTPDAVIMYLWQNENTVVIGKSQNAWRECRNELLEAEGGILVRRTSGGGAVFHDKGNLCYSFLCSPDRYDMQRILGVIVRAVSSLGINATFTGRNDIVAEGRKFSGNAFRFSKTAALMHGTLLLNADLGKMTRYLNVSAAKMQAKGVSSVRSRVINLCELNPALTTAAMSQALIEAFVKEYDSGQDGQGSQDGQIELAPPPVIRLHPETVMLDTDGGQVELVTLAPALPGGEDFYRRYQRFASWEWRFGETMPFELTLEHKFNWGLVELGMNAEHGVITALRISTDAMDADLGETLSACLKGVRLDASALRTAAECAAAIIKTSGRMLADPEELVNDIVSLLTGL